jgi:hypothetical protein
VRWAEGAIRAAVEWTPALLTSPVLTVSRRVDRLGYVVELLVPFAVAGALAGTIAARSVQRTAAIVAGAYGTAAVLAFVAIARSDPGSSGGPRAIRSLRAAALICLWHAAVPRGALRVIGGPAALRYESTPHLGMPKNAATPMNEGPGQAITSTPPATRDPNAGAARSAGRKDAALG